MSDYQTFEADGFKVTSNTLTSEQIGESLASQKADPEAEPAPETPKTNPEAAPENVKADGTPQKSFRQIAKHDKEARILEATQKAAAERRRADEAERRAKELEERHRALLSAKPEEPAKPSKKEDESELPDLDDYPSIAAHSAAVARYVLKQEREAEKQAQEQARENEKRQKQETERSAKDAAFASLRDQREESDPVFKGLVETYREQARSNQIDPSSVISWVPVSRMKDQSKAHPGNFVAEYLTSREDGGFDLLVYLETNPDAKTRVLSARDPVDLYGRLAKVEEERLSGAITATPQAVQVSSKAAPPARPVTGGPTTGRISPEKESFEQFAARRLKEEQTRR